jgi:hypothetical protein
MNKRIALFGIILLIALTLSGCVTYGGGYGYSGYPRGYGYYNYDYHGYSYGHYDRDRHHRDWDDYRR